MTDPRVHLRALAEATAPGGNVTAPREWILAVLDPPTAEIPTVPPAALTVLELAARFQRHPSTVRLWLERGRFPGAFKLRNRDWRIPPPAITAFEAAEQRGDQPPESRAKTVNLSDWRHVS